jgi:hypothetical protein
VQNYDDFGAERIKHLEMIQAVIARMASNSFLIKGWAVTLTVALLGFAVSKSHAGLAAAALIPIAVFGLLDGYYLRTERVFRALYNRVRDGSDRVTPFYMGATSDVFLAELRDEEKSWQATYLSRTVFGFYIVLLVTVALVVALLICSHQH